MEYAYNKTPQGRIARARLTRVNASRKDLGQVCRNVRGKDTGWAISFLEGAAEGTQAVRFYRNAKSKGHRRELGGKQGGFPKKSAKAVLSVVESANANANRLGLGATRIAHIITNKQATYPRMSPKGRRIRHDYEVSFIEVVLEEKQQKIGAEKKDAAKAASAPGAEAQKAAEQKKTGAAPQKKAEAPRAPEQKKA